MQERLTWRDGWLCVEQVDTELSEPKLIRRFYPVAPMSEATAKTYPLGTTLKRWGEAYCYETLDGRVIALLLNDGPETKPIAVEEEELKPPARGRYVWRNGQWYKVLKRGEIPAGIGCVA